MEKYPKTIKIKDSSTVTVRPYLKEDFESLTGFFQSLPKKERMYLRIDVTNIENLRKRFGTVNYDTRFPLLAMSKYELAGIGTLTRAEFGWMRNLGEIRVVIKPNFQRKGLCTILTRELFLYALTTDLYKLQASIMENQQSARSAFERMGFHQEAILKKHVTDIDGKRQNLVIMNLDIQDLWATMDDFIKDKFYVT